MGDYRRYHVGVHYRLFWPAGHGVLARYCVTGLDSHDAQDRRYMDDLRCKPRGHHDAHFDGSRRGAPSRYDGSPRWLLDATS